MSAFFDTNVILYAFDASSGAKRTIAGDLIRDHMENRTIAVSAQVLGEFFVNVTEKFVPPMSTADAKEAIDQLCQFTVVPLDQVLVLRAIEAHKRYRLSYWDGLIVAAAERADCEVLYSEDLNHGQTYCEVKAVNPFASQSVN